MGKEETVRTDDNRADLLLDKGRESRVDFTFTTRVYHLNLPRKCRSSPEYVRSLGMRVRIGRVYQVAN